MSEGIFHSKKKIQINELNEKAIENNEITEIYDENISINPLLVICS